MLMPDAPDCSFTDALCLGHGARAPVRRRRRPGLERRVDNGGDLFGGDPLPAAGARRIMQHPADAGRHVATQPVMHVIPAQRQPRRDLRGPHLIGQHQQDAGAHGQFLGRVAIRHDLRQLRAVRRRQHHAQSRHEHAPPYRFAAPKYSEFMY